jgi:hypothetical protein
VRIPGSTVAVRAVDATGFRLIAVSLNGFRPTTPDTVRQPAGVIASTAAVTTDGMGGVT